MKIQRRFEGSRMVKHRGHMTDCPGVYCDSKRYVYRVYQLVEQVALSGKVSIYMCSTTNMLKQVNWQHGEKKSLIL